MTLAFGTFLDDKYTLLLAAPKTNKDFLRKECKPIKKNEVGFLVQKMFLEMKKRENNSYGIGYPIIGKVKDFTHFVWMGANDVESSLRQTKQMLSDDLFASFSKDVAGIRKVVTTTMMVREMDF